MKWYDWYFEVLKKYAVFRGRARREEFWYYVLLNFIISTALYIIGIISPYHLLMVIYWIYALAVFIPGLAVGIRRLHDIGKSGWWILLDFIPIIGWIIIIIFWVTDSQPGENIYGLNPKTIAQ